jgi:protein-S-isoprenylcysteine O-methyltransferase Ste14
LITSRPRWACDDLETRSGNRDPARHRAGGRAGADPVAVPRHRARGSARRDRGSSSWIGVLLFSLGLVFAIWTCRLFVTVGQGTPAPWDPPNKLVVHGPYRHVRNPMITSVLLMLAGEAVFLQSWVLAGWLLVFFLANAIYFPLSEEKALERRFGDQYRVYKANVPRWLPRLRPWHQP